MPETEESAPSCQNEIQKMGKEITGNGEKFPVDDCVWNFLTLLLMYYRHW